MPARRSTERAIAARVRNIVRPIGGSTSPHPESGSSSDRPVLDDQLIDNLTARLTSLVVNDQGPYLENNEPWISGGSHQDLPNQANLLDPPSELTIEDVSEISKTLTTPPNPGPTAIRPTTTAAKELGQRTIRTHEIFDRIELQIAELRQELDLSRDTISHEGFTAIESKYKALQEGLAKQKRKTESLDARKAQLIAQLTALNGRIKATHALLPPDTRPRKCSNGEVLSLISPASS
jgi:hypothetical protein